MLYLNCPWTQRKKKLSCLISVTPASMDPDHRSTIRSIWISNSSPSRSGRLLITEIKQHLNHRQHTDVLVLNSLAVLINFIGSPNPLSLKLLFSNFIVAPLL